MESRKWHLTVKWDAIALKKRESIMETKEQEAEEEMIKIINFIFADMKYHDLLEEIKRNEQNKES